MSYYERKKALRVPLEKYSYNQQSIVAAFPELDELLTIKTGFFNVELAYNKVLKKLVPYLDYIIFDDECDYGYGDYSKSRYLTEKEKIKYKPKFQKYLPYINMDDVHLVEYCYYNCSEPDDCYDPEEDDFNKEV